MSPVSKMFYVPQITECGALVQAGYFRAESASAAKEKASATWGVSVGCCGPAQELSETYCTAMGISETK